MKKSCLACSEELRREPKSVLFIDEIHLIMGTGTVEGAGTDLANLLKPALARGELRCVGATTLQEYRKFIEKDPAINGVSKCCASTNCPLQQHGKC